MAKSLERRKRRDDDDSGEKPTHGKLKVKFTSFGPKQSTLDAAARAELEDPLVEEYLEDTLHRLLSIEAVDSPTNCATRLLKS